MNEAQLRNDFIEFLRENKGYPSDSILVEVPIVSNKMGRFRADLLLIDTRIGEYIGLVEFKNQLNPQVKKSAKYQVFSYLKAMNSPTLPAYIVTPSSDGFNIIVATEEEDWEPISKEQFPEFETLSSKKIIEEKEKIEKEEKEEKLEVEKKQKLRSIRALIPLTGIIIGLTATIISSRFLMDDNLIFADTCDCEEIVREIDSLKAQLDKINSSATISKHVDSTYVVDSTNTFKQISDRVEVLENGISQTPEKALSVLNLSKEIEKLDEKLTFSKESSAQMKEDLKDRIDLNRSFLIGIIITIVTIAIGVLLTYYYEKNKNTANNT